MKKFIFIFCLIAAFKGFSQLDPGDDSTFVLIPHPEWTIDPNDTLVARYDFNKKPVKKSAIAKTEADTTFNLKSAFKFQFTTIFSNRFSLTYERVFKYKYSWELQPAYIFANPLYDEPSQAIRPNIAFKNTGIEVRFGINLLKVKPYRDQKQKLHSSGLFISYRYQHADNVDYSNDGKGGQGYYYSYKVSQTKNLVGVFYRKRKFQGIKRAGIETFYEVGFYAGYSRTVVFSYVGAYGTDSGEPLAVQNIGIPFENGIVLMPVVRLGMALRYNRFRKM